MYNQKDVMNIFLQVYFLDINNTKSKQTLETFFFCSIFSVLFIKPEAPLKSTAKNHTWKFTPS